MRCPPRIPTPQKIHPAAFKNLISRCHTAAASRRASRPPARACSTNTEHRPSFFTLNVRPPPSLFPFPLPPNPSSSPYRPVLSPVYLFRLQPRAGWCTASAYKSGNPPIHSGEKKAPRTPASRAHSASPPCAEPPPAARFFCPWRRESLSPPERNELAFPNPGESSPSCLAQTFRRSAIFPSRIRCTSYVNRRLRRHAQHRARSLLAHMPEAHRPPTLSLPVRWISSDVRWAAPKKSSRSGFLSPGARSDGAKKLRIPAALDNRPTGIGSHGRSDRLELGADS